MNETNTRIFEALKKTLIKWGCFHVNLQITPIEEIASLGEYKAECARNDVVKDPMDEDPQPMLAVLDFDGYHFSHQHWGEMCDKLDKALTKSGLPFHLGSLYFSQTNGHALGIYPGAYDEAKTFWGRRKIQEKAEREANKARKAQEQAEKEERKAARAQQARERHERDLVGTGTCQCCQRNIKMRDGKLVDHGYECPRDIYNPKYTGHHEGNCSGVAELPYEKDCSLVQHILGNVRYLLEGAREDLEELQSGRVVSITREESGSWDPKLRGFTKVQRTYTPELGYTWTRVLEETIYHAQSKVDNLIEQERYYRVLVEIWKVRPLPTEEGFEELHTYHGPALRAARVNEESERSGLQGR